MNIESEKAYRERSIFSIIFPERYSKLIGRIQSSLHISPTIGNILDLNPHEFQNVKGVGKKYVEDLINFQNILPELLVDIKSPVENSEEPKIVANIDNNCNDKFKSLLEEIEQKIKNLQKLNLNGHNDNNSLPKICVDAFEELEKINMGLQSIINIYSDVFNDENIPNSIYLNYSFFDEKEIKALRKIELFLTIEIDLKSLLKLDLENLNSQPGFGFQTSNSLKNIIEKAKIEFDKNRYERDQQELKRNMLVPVNDQRFDLSAIDAAILEDTEEYLLTLKEQEIDIAMKRWGFHRVTETLEQIGTTFNTSRERIRQIETAINDRLRRYLRIHPKVLWLNFREHLSPELPIKIPALAGCFLTDESFYDFLDICFDFEIGTVKNLILPIIKNDVFDKYFTLFPSPASQEDLVNWLIAEDIADDVSISKNYISQLEARGIIEKKLDGFMPKALGQVDAVAHVLTRHPKGLPWQDIIQIINALNYTKNKINERKMPGKMFDNENIYLSDRGTYRHIKFADFEKIDIEKVLLDILYFFDNINDRCIHLYTDYFQKKKESLGVDYYSLRHIVRKYGAMHGIYFLGRSQVDTISLQPNPDSVTLKDAILKTLKNSEKSLTLIEIAQCTRSRNQYLTFMMIQNLQQDGKVVRVDQMLYTIPDRAFDSIDQNMILENINNIIESSSRIVESDVFREQINMKFNYSYSKYFYASLAFINQKGFSWHCTNQFFCKKPFSYRSMIEIMDEFCSIELDQEKNMEKVQKIIWLTRRKASSAYYNWRFKKRSEILLQDT